MSRNLEQSANSMTASLPWLGAELSPVTEPVQGWFSRVASGEPNRELQVRVEERQKERTRIARELHDTLFQGFLGVSMLLQSAMEKMPADSPSMPSLNRVLLLMRRVMEEGRDALRGLHTSSGPSKSLEEALAEVGDEFVKRGAQLRVSVVGRAKPLHAEIQHQIYLIAREALVNAFRHSGASLVEVEIVYLPGKMRLMVRDNGSGINHEVLQFGRDSHWGLQGMHERARNIEGQLRIWSRLGAGTEVEICVPACGGTNGHQPA